MRKMCLQEMIHFLVTQDFEWVILHLTVSWFRNYEKLLDLR